MGYAIDHGRVFEILALMAYNYQCNWVLCTRCAVLCDNVTLQLIFACADPDKYRRAKLWMEQESMCYDFNAIWTVPAPLCIMYHVHTPQFCLDTKCKDPCCARHYTPLRCTFSRVQSMPIRKEYRRVLYSGTFPIIRYCNQVSHTKKRQMVALEVVAPGHDLHARSLRLLVPAQLS